MTAPKKQEYRKRHLFARSLDEVVKNATKPMMDKQGKIYGALLANWPAIVGEERAKHTRPGRLQFPAKEATGATLHLDAHPAKAPELQYAHEQILEQCARYFGYRAITRIIIHPAHDMIKNESSQYATRSAQREPERSVRGGSGSDGGLAPSAAPAASSKTPDAPTAPQDMRELLQRLKSRIMSNAEPQ
jgi:hypothetical protein